VKIGETKVAVFRVTNHSDKAITGRAVFNVTPEQAGAYFEKLSCFCFTDQTIQAGQTVEMPVLYFVDPKYADDPDTKGKGEVTLSYTFYPAVDAKPTAKVAAAKAGKAG
jgi:cytochrome c oxidase assembly protein subunit 11